MFIYNVLISIYQELGSGLSSTFGHDTTDNYEYNIAVNPRGFILNIYLQCPRYPSED